MSAVATPLAAWSASAPGGSAGRYRMMLVLVVVAAARHVADPHRREHLGPCGHRRPHRDGRRTAAGRGRPGPGELARAHRHASRRAPGADQRPARAAGRRHRHQAGRARAADAARHPGDRPAESGGGRRLGRAGRATCRPGRPSCCAPNRWPPSSAASSTRCSAPGPHHEPGNPVHPADGGRRLRRGLPGHGARLPRQARRPARAAGHDRGRPRRRHRAVHRERRARIRAAGPRRAGRTSATFGTCRADRSCTGSSAIS